PATPATRTLSLHDALPISHAVIRLCSLLMAPTALRPRGGFLGTVRQVPAGCRSAQRQLSGSRVRQCRRGTGFDARFFPLIRREPSGRNGGETGIRTL